MSARAAAAWLAIWATISMPAGAQPGASAPATVATTAAAAAMPAAAPAELTADLPGARLQGSGRLRFLGLHVYDARLWAGTARVPDEWSTTPFALELQYARGLKGELIAERSLAEMKRVGDVPEASAARWLAQMKQLFPDVQAQHRITGVNVPGVGARFFVNGQLRGEVREPEFARLFFGIWLAPRTSEPTLRSALLGRGAPQ